MEMARNHSCWYSFRGFCLRRSVNLGALLFLLVAPVTATSIVAIRTNRRIVISADSMASVTRNGVLIKHGEAPVCKIGLADSLVYALAGTVGTGRGSIIEDVPAILGKSGSFDEKIHGFEEAIIPRLLGIAKAFRTDDPGNYDSLLRNYILEGVFASFVSGSPVLVARMYRLTKRPDGSIFINTSELRCPAADCPANLGVLAVALGVHEGIDEAIKNPAPLLSPNLPRSMQKLVLKEIATRPGEVGPPVSTLIWDQSGLNWYEGKSGACQANLK